MANLSFNKLGLKTNKEVLEFEFNGQVVEVKQFLPSLDKVHLISSAVKSSMVDGIINRDILEINLNYLVVANYTNVSFSTKDIQKMSETYDKLESTGFLEAVIEHLPVDDYSKLFESSTKLSDQLDTMATSALNGYASQIDSKESLLDLIGSISAGPGKAPEELK